MECVGRHIRTDFGYDKILEYAFNNNLCVIQIFVGNPSTYLIDREIYKFIELQKKRKIKIFIHAHYTINLAKPKASIPYRKSINLLIKILQISKAMGDNCLGVVVHMGKNVDKLSDVVYLDNFIEGIKHCIETVPGSCLVLETSAGQGSEIGHKLPELFEIFDKLSDYNVKLCVDTSHVWAAGYTPDDKLLKKINKSIKGKLYLVHINNSSVDKDSNIDRHADLKNGKIDIKDLEKVIKYSKKNGLYLIAETPLKTLNAFEENKFIVGI